MLFHYKIILFLLNNQTWTKRTKMMVLTYRFHLKQSLSRKYLLGYSKYHLIYEGQQEKIADGSEVNGFYICAHTPVIIKTNKGNQIKLSTNNFYNLKQDEIITHKKYDGFLRFTKI